jgi:hypothetical protein
MLVLNFARIRALLTVGEQRMFVELRTVAELAISANTIVKSMISVHHDPELLRDQVQQMRILEKQGDEKAFQLRENILNGAISPNVLDNLLECVELTDSIVDNYYWVTREINRIQATELGTSNGLALSGSQFEPIFSKLLEHAGSALSALVELLATTDTNMTQKLRRKIEDIEENADNIKDEGFDKLYANAQSMSYLQFFHYSELLHKFDNIVDTCEDLADLVLSIISSVSR